MSPWYILFFIWIANCAGSRGPHHPRGETVARHHVHYKPMRDGEEQKLTQDNRLLHDTAHLQEHLEDVVEEPDLSNLSDEELEFYYFQLHDTDNNSKLDGLEILQAILHTTHSQHKEETPDDGNNDIDSISNANTDLEYYIELIDRVLEEDDKDKDGYLNYPEFVAGGRKTNIQPSVKVIK